jgi:hypothetical protein
MRAVTEGRHAYAKCTGSKAKSLAAVQLSLFFRGGNFLKKKNREITSLIINILKIRNRPFEN